MIDERDLLKRIIASAEVEAAEAVGPGLLDTRDACRRIISILDRALATQPDADPVPELPEWVECDEDGDYIVHFDNRLGCCLAPHYRAEDYDRIAEAARILAARERARRE